MLLRDLAFEESGMKNARTVIEPNVSNGMILVIQ